MLTEIVDKITAELLGGLEWPKQLIFGEFDEDRPLSVVVATMLVCFVPGAVIVISARDLAAILVRLAKHPEKRDHVGEWMLLIACAIPLVLPVLAAAAGAAVFGIGAVVGGIMGSEVGGILRNVCLLLIKEGAYGLDQVSGFLRIYIKGDILKVLRDIDFARYQKPLAKYIDDFIGKLIRIIQSVQTQIQKLPRLQALRNLAARLRALELAFYDVQRHAIKAIPEASRELQARLRKLVSQDLPKNPRSALPAIPAPQVKPMNVDSGRRVRTDLGTARSPDFSHKVPSDREKREWAEFRADAIKNKPWGIDFNECPEGVDPYAWFETQLVVLENRARVPLDNRYDGMMTELNKDFAARNLHPETPRNLNLSYTYVDGVLEVKPSKTRWFYRPGVKFDADRGDGLTTRYGDMLIGVAYKNTMSAAENADKIRRVYYHEKVHQFLRPTFLPFREFRVKVNTFGYSRIQLLRYIEEALADTVAQYRVHGFSSLRPLVSGLSLPFHPVYKISLKVVLAQATGLALGTVAIEGLTYWVYEELSDESPEVPSKSANPTINSPPLPAPSQRH